HDRARLDAGWATGHVLARRRRERGHAPPRARPVVQAHGPRPRPRRRGDHERPSVRALGRPLRRGRPRKRSEHGLLRAPRRLGNTARRTGVRTVAAERRRAGRARRDRVTEGPARDLIGYGRVPPRAERPDGPLAAANLVLAYEEGS